MANKRYTSEFKAEVVAALLDEYRSPQDVEATFGVPHGTFSGWAAAARAERRVRAEAARMASAAGTDAAEVIRLKQENIAMRMGLDAAKSNLISAEDALSEIRSTLVTLEGMLDE